MTKCVARLKQRKEEEKENKWKTLKNRFKSTRIKRPKNIVKFERSKTMKESSTLDYKSYVYDELSLSNDSIKDESEELELDANENVVNQEEDEG